MSAEVFVDASLFMGMHAREERVRAACKGFFAERLGTGVLMSLEQVGRCDDLVWRFPRALQDAYYPFMDNLHTDMSIERLGYGEADLRTALGCQRLSGLPMHERLLLAMVLNRDALLCSVSPRLRGRSDLPVRAPAAAAEPEFAGGLEPLYRCSLRLRVEMEEL